MPPWSGDLLEMQIGQAGLAHMGLTGSGACMLAEFSRGERPSIGVQGYQRLCGAGMG